MGRGRQVERQWRLLAALQASRRGCTVPEMHELSSEECSRRTVYRDLQDLQAAGFPLVEDDGRWRVLGAAEGGWTVPVEPTEALGLFLGQRLLAPLAGTLVGDALGALRRKLLAALTPEGRKRVARLESLAEARIPAPVPYDAFSAQVMAIQRALAEQRRLLIVYRTPGKEPAERRVDPYCTLYHPGRLYLVGFCHRREDLVRFAVQRIERADVLDERFEPDPSFDPSSFVRRSFGVFGGPAHSFAIDFHPEVAHLVRETQFHATQRVVELEDGWTRMSMDCSGLPEVAAWVASFGGLARPVRPRELVEEVRRRHREGLAVMTPGDVTPDVTRQE